MQLERMTTKVREAVQAAADLARSKNHPEVGPAHLFLALVDQEGGILPDLLRRAQRRPGRVPPDPRAGARKAPRRSKAGNSTSHAT